MSTRIAAIESKLRELPDGREYCETRIDLLNRLAWHLGLSGQLARMLALSKQAMDLAKEHNYREGQAQGLRNSAFVLYMHSQYTDALRQSLEALHLHEELGNQEGEAYARTVIGLVLWSLGNYDEALKQDFQALRFLDELGDDDGLAWCMWSIGSIYHSLRDYQQARSYHERTLRIFTETGQKVGEARALTGLGAVCQALGEREKALEYHTHSLEIYRSMGNRVGEARALNDIGTIYHEQGDDERALQLHMCSLKIRTEDGNRQAETSSLLNIGRIYLKQKRIEEALKVLHQALSIAEAIGAKPKAYQAHQLLSQAYEESGALRDALQHEKDFHRIREEVFSEESSTKLRNLQISLEMERAQKEAEIQRLHNLELTEKNEELARLLDELRATQAQLVQSEKMAALGSLVAAIAHEINSPLGAIRSSLGLCRQCARRVIDAVERSDSLEKVRSSELIRNTLKVLQENEQVIAQGVQRIGKIVQSLKSFAQLDQAEYRQADLLDALENTLTLIQPDLRERVTIVRRYGALPRIFCYAAELNQVFMNLLQNAAQAIEGKGTITITTFADTDYLHIEIADTGRGIPQEQISRLFNPAFKTEGARVRAAIGLFTCLNIVQKHDGDIRVESEPGKCSKFTILLPRNLETRVLPQIAEHSLVQRAPTL